MDDIKQMILNHVDDLVSNFLYYDRKDDEELPVGAIETAIKEGLLTIEEIITMFEDTFRASLN